MRTRTAPILASLGDDNDARIRTTEPGVDVSKNQTLKQLLAPFDPPGRSLVDRLRYWAREQSDQVAFCYLSDGESNEVCLTYGQLDRRARAIAAELQSRGLTGQRGLLLYPPGLEFVAAFLGCLYAGVVAVPGFPPRRNRNMKRIQAISDDAQASAALSVASTVERTMSFVGDVSSLNDLDWLSTDTIPDDLAGQW